MKKRFLIPACVLSVALIGWVIFAMLHPELSFPWDSRTSGILYGLLADTVVLLFILAFCKNEPCSTFCRSFFCWVPCSAWCSRFWGWLLTGSPTGTCPWQMY